MKISAFTITTNCLANQYPVIESLKSIYPLVDEIIVVDGYSTDKTVEEIKKIGDKIIVIQDEDTRWEDNWVYWRMGKNWSRGFDECAARGADWIIKFDTDYILNNTYDLRSEFEKQHKEQVLTICFGRLNFMLTDRFFMKRRKTFAVNMNMCREKGIPVRWGYDLKNWGLCDEVIRYEFTKDKLLQGTLLSLESKIYQTAQQVFNYGYCFRDKETSQELMYRNMRAFLKQKKSAEQTKEKIWKDHVKASIHYFKASEHQLIKLTDHPKEIQEKIKNLTSDKQGYNFWGQWETSKYYDY